MAKGKKTGGRKPGSLNKNSARIKDSILNVFDRLGGDEAFFLWAQDNKTDFYKMTQKLIPRDLNLNVAMRLEDIVAGSEDPGAGE